MAETMNEPSPILHGVIAIVSAHLANNAVAVSEVPAFIRSVHSALTELEGGNAIEHVSGVADVGTAQLEGDAAGLLSPAVPIARSITDDFLICLEDGKRLRMLKRYLATQYGLTPEAYRTKWGLPADYPMVAPSVTEQRRKLAVSHGFGRTQSRPKRTSRRAK